MIWTDRFGYSLEEAMDLEWAVASRVSQRLTGRPTRGMAGKVPPRSTSAYALYLRAGDYLEDADDPSGPDEALRLYQRALDADPDFALAWAGRSRALWKIWNRDKTAESIRLAEEAADRAVRLDPELLEARLARAQIYRATSRYAASIGELQAVLSVTPNWDEAEVQLAAAYRESGDLVKAEASLRRAVALRPEYWRNWNQLGALLVRRGDYAGARTAFQQVVRLIPDKNRGYEQLAAVELLEADYAAAIDTYEKLPVPVQDGALATNIGTAYFYQRRLPEAERYYRLATGFEPRNPTYRLNLGDLHTRAGRPDSARVQYLEAVRLFEDMLHVDPNDTQLKLIRAVGLAKSGDCGQAEAALKGIASSLPANDAQSAHEVARIEAVCGQRARALEALRKAVALGFSVRLIQAEDEFRALAGDPAFLALVNGEKH